MDHDLNAMLEWQAAVWREAGGIVAGIMAVLVIAALVLP